MLLRLSYASWIYINFVRDETEKSKINDNCTKNDRDVSITSLQQINSACAASIPHSLPYLRISTVACDCWPHQIDRLLINFYCSLTWDFFNVKIQLRKSKLLERKIINRELLFHDFNFTIFFTFHYSLAKIFNEFSITLNRKFRHRLVFRHSIYSQ